MNSHGIATLGEIDQHDTRIEGYSEPFWDHLLLICYSLQSGHLEVTIEFFGHARLRIHPRKPPGTPGSQGSWESSACHLTRGLFKHLCPQAV